jgi:hypothetical protein
MERIIACMEHQKGSATIVVYDSWDNEECPLCLAKTNIEGKDAIIKELNEAVEKYEQERGAQNSSKVAP